MKKQENKRGEAGERPWLRATLAALRGGLLAASILGVPIVPALCICIIGNILPIPFILLFIENMKMKLGLNDEYDIQCGYEAGCLGYSLYN